MDMREVPAGSVEQIRTPSPVIIGMSERGPTHYVLFFRGEGFYPLELPISDDLDAHAKCNPGTKRIEDIAGNILWELEEF